jgi:hypothetical protein
MDEFAIGDGGGRVHRLDCPIAEAMVRRAGQPVRNAKSRGLLHRAPRRVTRQQLEQFEI